MCQITTDIAPYTILYSPELVQFERDRVRLLIDPGSPNWISCNSLASRVIRACDGRHTWGEINKLIENEHKLSADSFNEFISQAIQAGFIATTPDLAPAYRGRGSAIAPQMLEELWINTNNSCPLNCCHCLIEAGRERTESLSAQEIIKLVDEAITLGVKRIYFTGGDPLLHRDLFSLVKYITPRAHLVLMTSGALISSGVARDLKEAGNDNLLVQVSLEGPDARTNDVIRGQGSFDLALCGIQHLIRSGLTPVVTTTLTRLNAGKASQTTRFLASVGVKDQHILWLHSRGRLRQNRDSLLLPGEEVSRIMGQIKQAGSDCRILVDNLESLAARVRGKRGLKNDLCNSGYGILSVNADGKVYPCAALAGATAFDCGSVKEQSLHSIWLDSPVMKSVRENSVQKKVGCNTCFLKYFCGGGCFAQAYFEYEVATGEGCLMAPDPYCAAYKDLILEIMWQLAEPKSEELIDEHPVIYRQMENKLPQCAVGGNKILDAAQEVGTFHCSCVLAMEKT